MRVLICFLGYDALKAFTGYVVINEPEHVILYLGVIGYFAWMDFRATRTKDA